MFVERKAVTVKPPPDEIIITLTIAEALMLRTLADYTSDRLLGPEVRQLSTDLIKEITRRIDSPTAYVRG